MAEDAQLWELTHARKLLQYLMSSSCVSVNVPFINEVDVKGLGLNDYHDIIKEPMWLNKMMQKFDDNVYQNITELVCDFRLMLLNCYRYNGVYSTIGKVAARFETIFEQKLQMLPHDLRIKSTIQVTLGGGDSEESALEAAGISRRRSINLTTSRILQNTTSNTPIRSLAEEIETQGEQLADGSTEDFYESRCAQIVDQLRSWEKRRLESNIMENWDTWWSEHCTSEDEFVLKHSNELCQVYQFLCLAEPVLCTTVLMRQGVDQTLRGRAKIFLNTIQQAVQTPEMISATPYTVTLTELEMALIAVPQASSLLNAIMQALLAKGTERSSWNDPNPNLKLLSYSGWSESLKKQVNSWYTIWKDRCKENKAMVIHRLKIDPTFFDVLGFDNPLEKAEFHELSLYQRIFILKALVEHSVYNQEIVRFYLDRVTDWNEVLHREFILGEFDGNVYVHFPCFLSDSYPRVYKYPQPQLPDMNDAVGGIADDAYYEVSSRIPMVDPSRVPTWFDELVQKVTAANKPKPKRGRRSRTSKSAPISYPYELFDIGNVHSHLELLDSILLSKQVIKCPQPPPQNRKRQYQPTTKARRSLRIVSSNTSNAGDTVPMDETDSAVDDVSNMSVPSKYDDEREEDSQTVGESGASPQSTYEMDLSQQTTQDSSETLTKRSKAGSSQEYQKDMENNDIKEETDELVNDKTLECSTVQVPSDENQNKNFNVPSQSVSHDAIDSPMDCQDANEEKLTNAETSQMETNETLNGQSDAAIEHDSASVHQSNGINSEDVSKAENSLAISIRKPSIIKPSADEFECVARDLSEVNILLANLRSQVSGEVSNGGKTRPQSSKEPERIKDLRKLIANLTALQNRAEEKEPYRVECVRLLRLKMRTEYEAFQQQKAKGNTKKERIESQSRRRETISQLSPDEDSQNSSDESYSDESRDDSRHKYSSLKNSVETREERLRQREARKAKITSVDDKRISSNSFHNSMSKSPANVSQSTSSNSNVNPRVFMSMSGSTPNGNTLVNKYSSNVTPTSSTSPAPRFPSPTKPNPDRPQTPSSVTPGVTSAVRQLIIQCPNQQSLPLVRPKIFKIRGLHYLESGQPVIIHADSERLEYMNEDTVPAEILKHARAQIQIHLERMREHR